MADEKNLVSEDNQGDIVIYQTEDGGTKIDVRFEGETVWLTQQQMAELFGSSCRRRKSEPKQAIEKANREYQRFVVQNLSPVEEAYLQTIKEVEKTAKKKAEEN